MSPLRDQTLNSVLGCQNAKARKDTHPKGGLVRCRLGGAFPTRRRSDASWRQMCGDDDSDRSASRARLQLGARAEWLGNVLVKRCILRHKSGEPSSLTTSASRFAA